MSLAAAIATFVVGMAILVTGVALYSVPAAMIVLGLTLCGVGFFFVRGE